MAPFLDREPIGTEETIEEAVETNDLHIYIIEKLSREYKILVRIHQDICPNYILNIIKLTTNFF